MTAQDAMDAINNAVAIGVAIGTVLAFIGGAALVRLFRS